MCVCVCVCVCGGGGRLLPLRSDRRLGRGFVCHMGSCSAQGLQIAAMHKEDGRHSNGQPPAFACLSVRCWLACFSTGAACGRNGLDHDWPGPFCRQIVSRCSAYDATAHNHDLWSRHVGQGSRPASGHCPASVRGDGDARESRVQVPFKFGLAFGGDAIAFQAVWTSLYLLAKARRVLGRRRQCTRQTGCKRIANCVQIAGSRSERATTDNLRSALQQAQHDLSMRAVLGSNL